MYRYLGIASCGSTGLHLPEASGFRATNALVAKEISRGKKRQSLKTKLLKLREAKFYTFAIDISTAQRRLDML